MQAPRTVLVTGGSGFIGSHLVQRLVREGHRVTLLQRTVPSRPDVDHIAVEEFSQSAIAHALEQRHFDWVFHLAAYGVHPSARDPAVMFRVNIEATHAVLQFAARSKPSAVVIAGSSSEYRFGGNRPVNEDHPLEPRQLYGASKAASTLWAAAFAREVAIPFVACRIFGVYGPAEAPHRLLPSLVSGLMARQRVSLSRGLQVRDFLFIDEILDVFLMLAKALEDRPEQTIVNLCSGVPTTVRAFAERVARELGASSDLLGFGDLPMRTDEPMYVVGDPDRLCRYIPWKPRIGIDEGIRRSLRTMAVTG